MGLNYFFLGDYDSAIPLLKDAKRRDAAHFSYPQLYLADIYTRRGETQAAMAEFEDFLLRHPDAEEVARGQGTLGPPSRKVSLRVPHPRV